MLSEVDAAWYRADSGACGKPAELTWRYCVPGALTRRDHTNTYTSQDRLKPRQVSETHAVFCRALRFWHFWLIYQQTQKNPPPSGWRVQKSGKFWANKGLFARPSPQSRSAVALTYTLIDLTARPSGKGETNKTWAITTHCRCRLVFYQHFISLTFTLLFYFLFVSLKINGEKIVSVE